MPNLCQVPEPLSEMADEELANSVATEQKEPYHVSFMRGYHNGNSGVLRSKYGRGTMKEMECHSGSQPMGLESPGSCIPDILNVRYLHYDL